MLSNLQAISFGARKQPKIVIQKDKVEGRIAVQNSDGIGCLFCDRNTGQPFKKPFDAEIVIV